MTITGYSDRINHALAFAAKHHDQQVRKGTRLPYLTRSANVAIILARYEQDDQTVVAGILRDVIEDFLLDAYSPRTVIAETPSGMRHLLLCTTISTSRTCRRRRVRRSQRSARPMRRPRSGSPTLFCMAASPRPMRPC